NFKSILKERKIDPRTLPVDSNLRAENFSVGDFVSLANFFS
ncbi:16S rRNA (adenine(1518)-N(6)/adenine(1519)-N(6))-dimethyltransferase, partial [Francisella tularensis subsp. holarctica]|nr:16S rRNA (adenine(1518)-N(6)/adenine(1519)-N(6))-dimethyltransferase [Francisella tularensis subsp. holarctica]